MSTNAYHLKKCSEKRFAEKNNKLEVTSINNWQKSLLLLSNEDDENVKQTIAKNASFRKHNSNKEEIKNLWNAYICKSIGGDILNSDKEFKVTCITIRYGKILKPFISILPGNSIIKHYWEHIKYAEGIRFTIIDATGALCATSIIVRP